MAGSDGASPGLVRAGVIAAVALIVLGAAAATPWVVTFEAPSFGSFEPPEVTLPPETMAPWEPPGDMPPPDPRISQAPSILLVALAAAVACLLIFRLVQRLRAAWRPDDARVTGTEAHAGEVRGDAAVDIASLATAVARAEARLDAAATPHDAVTAAWVALEDEAERQGTARDPAQTATEFTVVLLDRTPAPADAVSSLRALYHRARFTAHEVADDDVRAARAALTLIAASLDGHPTEEAP